VSAGKPEALQRVDARNDLEWLMKHGALAGAAEILRERRRQRETEGWTPALEDELTSGQLADLIGNRLSQLLDSRESGTADIGSDEENLRKAGALCAAEIDRLNRMMIPEGQD
jgi:hypothetical protein